MEPDQQLSLPPLLAGRRDDPMAMSELTRFAADHLADTAAPEITKARAAHEFRRVVREQRLPALDRWLAQRH